MKNQWIGLIDCNNFFVSCERLFRPELINKPVMVLSSNDGCVVARSQEVKDMGIPMGVPYFKIKDTVEKQGVVSFSSNLTLYRDISRRVFSVVRREVEVVEEYSIDEAFLLLDNEAKNRVKELRALVEREVGIPVSIGVSATKTQAKQANLLAKKSTGTQVLNSEDWLALTPTTKLCSIWGVGGSLELKFKGQGINTVEDLIKADADRVKSLFGLVGLRLQQELSGSAVFKVTNDSRTQKSLVHSRSFKKPTEDLAVLQDAVAYHTRQGAAELRKMKMETNNLRVMIRPSQHGDFLLRGGSLEFTLPSYTSDTIELVKLATKLTEELYETGVPYKKAGISMGSLQREGYRNFNLFSDATQHNEPLMEVIDKINSKGNKELITVGSRHQTMRWQAKKESQSPTYTTAWDKLVTVKAKSD